MGVRLVKYNLGNLVGSGGTYDHNDLLNRDLPDQHPISSITGLQEILDNLNTVDNVVDTYTVDLNYDTTTNTLKADVRIFDDGSDTNAIQSLATGLYVPKVITEDSNTITWEHVSLGETIEEIFQNGIVFSHASSSWNNIANSTEANAWYWDSSLESIVQPINTVTFTGYVSQDVYDYYTHTVTLKSSNSDNDDDGVVIAYMVDDTGKPHTLSAICCRQGTGIQNWALVYDYMLPDQQILAQGGSGGIANPGNSGSSGWNVYSAGITVQVTKFQNIVTCTCSNWGSTTLNENTKITIDLDNYSWGSLFRGDVHYGYCNHSQSYSYFKDIVFISDNSADATKLIAWVKISERDGNNLYELEDGLYVPKTETHTHDNKNTLDLFGQDTDGTLLFNGAKIKGGSDISKKPDNAIKELTDGLYVEDLSDEVEMLEKNLKIFTQYQRFVNTELEFAYFRLPAQSGIALNAHYNISHILSNEIEYTTNSFKLKAGKTYQINVGMTADGSSQQASNYALYDITSGCTVGTWGQLISSVWDSKWNDVPISCIYSPTQDCEIVLREKGNYTPAISSGFITVMETGRAIVVDPVEYVNEETGIEDTPVGHIMSHIGTVAPKHYLICDGSEYNISDYPYLAQHIIDNFGSVNHFGGNGVTTFATPNFLTWWTPAMTSNNSNGYIASCSSQWDSSYSAYKAFNGTISNISDAWHISSSETGTPWVQIDFQSPKMIYGIRRYPRYSYASVTSTSLLLQGSNDGINFTDIQTLNFDTWSEQTSQDRKLDVPVNYRIYRFANSAHIGDIYFLINENNMMQCIKSEPTYFIVKDNTNYLQPTLYSEEERCIGCWINGKPLYEKTFNATTPKSSSVAVIIDTTILDTSIIETVTLVEGKVKSTSGLFMPINFYYSSNEFICTYYHPNGIYMITPHSSYQNTSCFITIQYTKLSDAENSFTQSMITDFVIQSSGSEEVLTQEQIQAAIDEDIF